MKLIFILFLITTFISTNIFSNENAENCSIKNVPTEERSFSNNFSGVFNGKKLDYVASLKEKIIYEKDNPNEPLESFFYTD